jgi:streptomycin 6-kinase
VAAIRIPQLLADQTVQAGRRAWLAAHPESEHEGDGLALWDGDGAVRCHAARAIGQTSALLLERCIPGTQLKRSAAEPEQDTIIAGLLRRLWRRRPQTPHPFRPLREMCAQWADGTEARLEAAGPHVDGGLVGEAVTLLRELPRSGEREVLLASDLHPENVLASQREPWLVIDPKPYVGDPAYDAVQHMLNCDQRLARDPVALAARMASLLDLDPRRVSLWLFARCAQESLGDPAMREPARRLAP